MGVDICSISVVTLSTPIEVKMMARKFTLKPAPITPKPTRMSTHERQYREAFGFSDTEPIDEDDLITWSPEGERLHADDYLPYGEY